MFVLGTARLPPEVVHSCHTHHAPRGHTRLEATEKSSFNIAPEMLAANAVIHAATIQASEALFTGFGLTVDHAADAMKWREYGFPGPDRYHGSDGTAPPPFGAGDLARVSHTPLLTRAECDAMIHEADADFFGWRPSPARYGTDATRTGGMIPVEELQTTFNFVNEQLQARLFAAIEGAYPDIFAHGAAGLRLQGARLVKYDAAAGGVELGYHRDGTLLTANIALNGPEEYGGGGTLVEALLASRPVAICLRAGHVLLHPGNVRHAGMAISSGVRYLLVCFVMDAHTVEHDRFCHQRGEEQMALALTSTAAGSEARRKALTRASRHFADAYACGGRIDDGRDGGTPVVDAFRALGIEVAGPDGT